MPQLGTTVPLPPQVTNMPAEHPVF
jgi:hypothetical protein